MLIDIIVVSNNKTSLFGLTNMAVLLGRGKPPAADEVAGGFFYKLYFAFLRLFSTIIPDICDEFYLQVSV